MSDQYYYLLDGKEHGPFSRVAVKSLLELGQLNEILLRRASEEAWQTAEELGLVVHSQPSAESASVTVEPAALIFRSRRETQQKSFTGPMFAALFLIAIVGIGWWLTANPKGSPKPQTNDASTEEEVSISVAATTVGDANQRAADCAAGAQEFCEPEATPAPIPKWRSPCDEYRESLIGPRPSAGNCRSAYEKLGRVIDLQCQQIARYGEYGSVAARAHDRAMRAADDYHTYLVYGCR